MNAFLADMRVIDLTENLSGPYCSMILGDLGAEVIKIERITGDYLRTRGPEGRKLPFELLHRNKKSVCVDFTKPAGVEVISRLAQTADVVVENFRPGVLAKYGLDYESVRSSAPSIVYCSISGFGQNGPLARAAGVDLIAQGYSGLMSVTGFPGMPPARAGFSVSDVGSGTWSALGIVAALLRRRLSGEGAFIDVALSDSVLAWAIWEMSEYQMTGQAPGPLGSANRLTAPHGAFRCQDGAWIAVAISARPQQWVSFCEVLGITELLADARFSSDYARYTHREALDSVLQARFAGEPCVTWIDRFRAAGLACSQINTFADIAEDEQFRSRQMLVELDGQSGPVKVINSPIRAEGVPGAISPAPLLGQHTAAILGELGYQTGELQQLVAEEVVYQCR